MVVLNRNRAEVKISGFELSGCQSDRNGLAHVKDDSQLTLENMDFTYLNSI